MSENIPLLISPRPFTPELVNEVFSAAFGSDGLSSYLGAVSLDGQTIIDIGCGDGRYMHSLIDAGAEEVTGVEIHQCFIDKGQRNGWMAGKVICSDAVKLSKLPEHIGRYDTATIMNLAPVDCVYGINPLILAAHSLLKPDGQLILTLVEPRRRNKVTTDMQQCFKSVTASRVWRSPESQPGHNVMIVGIQKQILIEK